MRICFLHFTNGSSRKAWREGVAGHTSTNFHPHSRLPQRFSTVTSEQSWHHVVDEREKRRSREILSINNTPVTTTKHTAKVITTQHKTTMPTTGMGVWITGNGFHGESPTARSSSGIARCSTSSCRVSMQIVHAMSKVRSRQMRYTATPFSGAWSLRTQDAICVLSPTGRLVRHTTPSGNREQGKLRKFRQGTTRRAWHRPLLREQICRQASRNIRRTLSRNLESNLSRNKANQYPSQLAVLSLNLVCQLPRKAQRMRQEASLTYRGIVSLSLEHHSTRSGKTALIGRLI